MPQALLSDEFLKTAPVENRQVEYYDSSFTAGGSFGVRVSPSGRKAFFFIFKEGNSRKRKTLGYYPTLQLTEARQLAISIGRKAIGAESSSVPSSPSMKELCELFVRKHIEPNLKLNTQREYKRLLNKEILPLWSDRAISSIRAPEVYSLIEEIAFERRRSTLANRVRALLSKLFQFAIQRKLLASNPVLSIEAQLVEPALPRVLDWQEIRSLWSYLSNEEPVLEAAFKLLLLTAQRPSEVLGMRWKDIEFESWIVRRNKKGEAIHQLPLTPLAMQVLRPLKENSQSEHVFSGKRSEKLNFIRRDAKRIASAISPNEPWSPLDLRKTFEHRAGELGIRPDVVDKILGRKTTLPRLRKLHQRYDYTKDIKSALTLWSKKLTESSARKSTRNKRKSSAKVINLFE